MITRKSSISVDAVCLLWLSVILHLGACVDPIDIECMRVKDCPVAMKLIAIRPYAPETIQLLRHSHCGFDEKEAKIWCPILDFCITPDSKNGTCKKIQHCPSYTNYLKTVDLSDPVVRKYLKEFCCDRELDNELRVCCADEHKQNDVMHADDVHGRFQHDSIPSPDNLECGQQNTMNRIVGGTDTYLDEYPWLGLLKYVNEGKSRYACSGTLISNHYVLTAAHCVDTGIIKSRNLGKISSVVLGEYDTRNETDCFYFKYGSECADPLVEVKINSYVLHPEFSSKTMTNDIAILRLSTKVQFTDYIQPICLPPKELKLQGNETLMISGWGKTETESRSPVKKKAKVTYVDQENCNRYKRQILNHKQICVGTGNGIDTCYGDSGGPLMMDINRGKGFSTYIIGIVSYGYGQLCGATPGVYTFVPSFVEWIEDHINN